MSSIRFRIPHLAPALLAAALHLPGPLTAAPVARTVVPKDFLQGSFLANLAMEGGSDVEGLMMAQSNLVRVRFAFEERFLVVELAEDAYSNPRDRSLTAHMARFPMEDMGDSVRVAWGDDPSPFVTHQAVQTRKGIEYQAYQARGPSDVYGYELSPGEGYLTFVKKLDLTSPESGDRISVRLRYNFIRERETGFEPSSYPSPADFDRFGYFTSGLQMLADPEVGYLEPRSFLHRIDLRETFTYELHPSVPELLHKPIVDAIESWNDVFEARTGTRPLAVEPGQEDHMPGDLRYHVIYFRTRGFSRRGYSAYGPGVSIARTGQVIDADVIVDGVALMKEFKDAALAFMEEMAAEVAEAEARSESLSDQIRVSAPTEKEQRSWRFTINQQPLAMSQAQEDVFPVGFMEDELGDVAEKEKAAGLEGLDPGTRLYWTVRGLMTHEIGHNLGLRHNFGGSTDAKRLESGQLSTSIMDYAELGPNFHAPGPYDAAAIAFGYGGEVRQSERFQFLTDHHAETHPLANRHDLGDPLEFYRIYVERVMGPLRAGEKPSLRPEQTRAVLDFALFPLVKFVNNLPDARSDQAFQYLLDLLRFRFPADARYRAVEEASIAKLYAGLFLSNTGTFVGTELTRRQRRAVAQSLGEAIADPDHVLEEHRLRLVRVLAGTRHVSGKRALQAARDAVEANLDDPGRNDAQLEVEENVLMHLEKAVRDYLD